MVIAAAHELGQSSNHKQRIISSSESAAMQAALERMLLALAEYDEAREAASTLRRAPRYRDRAVRWNDPAYKLLDDRFCEAVSELKAALHAFVLELDILGDKLPRLEDADIAHIGRIEEEYQACTNYGELELSLGLLPPRDEIQLMLGHAALLMTLLKNTEAATSPPGPHHSADDRVSRSGARGPLAPGRKNKKKNLDVGSVTPRL